MVSSWSENWEQLHVPYPKAAAKRGSESGITLSGCSAAEPGAGPSPFNISAKSSFLGLLSRLGHRITLCHRDWGQCQHGAAEAAEFPGGLPWEIEKGSLSLPRLLPWVGFGHLPNCLTRHATQTCLLHLLFLSFLSPSNAERNDRTNLPLKSSGRRTQLAHSESGGTRHPVVGDLFPWTCSGHSNSLTYEHCRRASSGQG